MPMPNLRALHLCSLLQVFCSTLVFAQELTPSLQISGASEALERNIRSHVSLTGLTCETTPARLNRMLPEMRQNVLRASRALGFYQLSSEVRFVPTDSCWNLVVETEPGDPVTVADIRISINSSQNLFLGLIENLPVTTGDTLNHANYESIKSDLSTLAVEQGFMSARFQSSQLLLNLKENTADIEIIFEPGERYRFGEIEIEPLEELSSDFISRYINFSSDAFYSADALIELRNALNDSLYFSDVTVAPELNQAVDQRIPILVSLQTRPRRVYSVGTGITTDIGPRVRADYEDRYLNARGHKFQINSGASPIQSNLDLNYIVPMQKPATENLQFSGGFLSEDNDTYESQIFKVGATYSLMNRYEWRQNIFTTFQHDEDQLNDESEVADTLIAGINFSKTRADAALYPTRGWRLFGQISGASSELLSIESFLQLNLAGKLIETAGPGRFLVKFEVGTTLVDKLENLPVSIQYFSGGDQSIRGYKYQSLGPRNTSGEVIGGKHVLSGGIEYDFPIAPTWKLALFTDVGNSFDDWEDYKLVQSIGAGIRWLSPIGPIRIDLASALDEDNKLRLHITMGPDL